MLRKLQSVALTVVLSALSSEICADEKTDLSEIRQVISAVHMSVIKGNEQEFLSHFILTKDFEKPLKAAFQYQQKVIAFEDALNRKLGADAVLRFKRIKVDKSFEPTFLPRDTKWVSTVKIDVEKDQASFRDPNTGVTTPLIRKEGAWKASPGDMGDLAGTEKLYEELQKVLIWAKEQVEKDVDLRRIKTEMGERYWSILQGG